MSTLLTTWIDQQQEALAEQVCGQLLSASSSAFQAGGAAMTRQFVACVVTALQDDIRSGGSDHLRATLISLIDEWMNFRLSFQDLSLFATHFRTILVSRLDATTQLDASDRRALEDWLYQLALQSGLYFIVQRDETIDEQASELELRFAELQAAYAEQSRLIEVIRQVSTPIAPVFPGILVVPLVGTIDSYRAQMMTERLLEAIVEEEAEFVILDISGVPLFDTAIAQHLMVTAKAAHLLGTRIVLAGLSPELAQTVVQLGIEMDSLVTRRNLQDGLAHVLDVLKYRIVSTRNSR